MAALVDTGSLDLAGESPGKAREAIKALLAAEPGAGRKVYAALAHKVWSLLVERNFDAELRDWHHLVLRAQTRVRGEDSVAAERMTVLADFLSESISFAESSPVHEMARRPQAWRILSHLASFGGFVARRDLLDALGLKSSHLSNVLTQLLAHGLVERQGRGREAEYAITALGRKAIGAELPEPREALLRQLAPQLVEQLMTTRDLDIFKLERDTLDLLSTRTRTVVANENIRIRGKFAPTTFEPARGLAPNKRLISLPNRQSAELR